MRRFVDLHIHTNCSDGVFSPSEVLEIARRKELTAFSITDHDTIRGYETARDLATEDDPELIPGLELSVTSGDSDLHLLAYFFDPNYKPLKETLEEFCEYRNQRAGNIVKKLNDMEIDITFDEVIQTAGNAAIGRPHIAATMHSKGTVASYQLAFDKYIGNGKPAFVPKKNFTPEQALSLIHDAGGVVVLAHPVIEDTYQHLEMLVGLGLDGIEVYHPAHKQKHIDQFKHLAERFRLVMTGGSDSHGREGRYGEIGSQHVPEELMTPLRQHTRQREEKA